jgi:hypothetical protein
VLEEPKVVIQNRLVVDGGGGSRPAEDGKRISIK